MRWAEIRHFDSPEGLVVLRRRQTLLMAMRGPAQMLLPRRRWQVARRTPAGEQLLLDTKDEALAWHTYRSRSGDDR